MFNFILTHKKKFLFLSFIGLTFRTTETHYLYPPLFDPVENVQGHIPCFRPCRDEGIRMEMEEIISSTSTTTNTNNEKKKKIIFHNYGHGGSGWSTGPGSVKYVLEEYFDKLVLADENNTKETPSSKKNEKIAVIGAGLIGCFTVISLLQRGFKNITVFAESDQDLTSHKAAGLVGVFAANSDSEEVKKKMEKASVDTFKYYVNEVMAPRRDNDDDNNDHRKNENQLLLVPPADTARRLPRYMGNADLGCDCDVYVKAGLMQPSREVQVIFVNPPKTENESDGTTIKTSTGLSSPTISMLRNSLTTTMYPDALFVDVRRIMDWFHKTIFEDLRIPKIITTIERERDILETNSNNNNGSILKDFNFIFNCAGSGSKELFKDEKLHRNGGHLVELCNQGPNRRTRKELNYVLDFVLSENSTCKIPGNNENKSRKSEQYIYYCPKGEGGVLGGTMIYDMEPDEQFNPEEFDRILDSARELFKVVE